MKPDIKLCAVEKCAIFSAAPLFGAWHLSMIQNVSLIQQLSAFFFLHSSQVQCLALSIRLILILFALIMSSKTLTLVAEDHTAVSKHSACATTCWIALGSCLWCSICHTWWKKQDRAQNLIVCYSKKAKAWRALRNRRNARLWDTFSHKIRSHSKCASILPREARRW